MKFCFVCNGNYRGEFLIHMGTKRHRKNEYAYNRTSFAYVRRARYK